MLTNELTGVTMEAMKALYGDNKMAECMYYISSVQKEYIEMALTTIDENYGGMDKFLVQQLGWTWRNFVSCICIRIRCFLC